MSSSKSLVNKATTNDRKPPSGFILQELASKTRSIEDCRQIEELVLKKLEKAKHAYVSYKALRVVKYICEHGSGQWRRSWRRHTSTIRQFAQYRGSPDAVYGDSPNEDVRNAAKEAMTAIFASGNVGSDSIQRRIRSMEGGGSNNSNSKSKSNSNRNFDSKSSNKITFSSGSHGTISTPEMHISSKNRNITGFGNDSYVPKVSGPFDAIKPSKSYTNPNSFSLNNPHAQGKIDNRVGRKNKKRRKQQIGGVWANDSTEEEEEDENDNSENNNNNNEYSYESDPNEFYSLDNPRKSNNRVSHKTVFSKNRENNKRSDGTYEKRWVNEITMGGGMGTKIANLKLKVQQFENLSQNHVLEFLDDKLNDNSWQTRAKSLTLIDALLNGNSSESIIEYFNESRDNLENMLNDKKSTIRKRAQQIWDRMGFAEEEEESSNDTNEIENNQSNENNTNTNNDNNSGLLIDFEDTKPKTETSNFLDDFISNVGTTETVKEAPVDVMFSSSTNNTNDSNNNESTNVVSMFSGMNVSNTPTTVTNDVSVTATTNSLLLPNGNNSQTQTQTQKQNENQTQNNDFFAGLMGNIPQNNSTTTNTNNTINDDSFLLNLGNQKSTNVNNNSGSLFGLNGNTGTTATTATINNNNNNNNSGSGFSFLTNVSGQNQLNNTSNNQPNNFSFVTNSNTNSNTNTNVNTNNRNTPNNGGFGHFNSMLNNMQSSMNQVNNMHSMNVNLMNQMNGMNTMNNIPMNNNQMPMQSNQFVYGNQMNYNQLQTNSGGFGMSTINTNSLNKFNDPFSSINSNSQTQTATKSKPKTTGKDPFSDLAIKL